MADIDRRTQEGKRLSNIAPTTAELLSEEIDGEVYSYRLVPQCRVCKAPESIRNLVDTLLLQPQSYRQVLKYIRPLEEKLGVEEKELISYDSIRNHQKNHLPMDKIIIRETVERRAREKNKSILEGVDRLLTPEAIYEVIAQKGWEDIVAGRVRPTLNQTMFAVKQLQELDDKINSHFRPEALISQLNAIIQAMRDVLPEEWLNKVLDKINQIEEEYVFEEPPALEAALLQDELDEENFEEELD